MSKQRLFSTIRQRKTLSYLINQYNKGNRIAVTRYGDGEYFIMAKIKEKGKPSSRQEPTEELSNLLNNAIKKEGQLICIPFKENITPSNINIDDINISEKAKLRKDICRYIITNSNHNLYGHVSWRDVDASSNKWDFTTEFFLGKTLLVTGHKEICERAFSGFDIDVYETLLLDAASEYHTIKDNLISICKNYKNIIFSCGAISKVLISDLIDYCESHLIDLGANIGIIVAKFSPNYHTARMWPNFLKRATPELIEQHSRYFFETLNKKK